MALPCPLTCIVSGGQTGADRAGLDFAIEHEIPHRGWCPKGRKAEDGVIPNCYRLKETPSSDYLKRTEWNVRDSDATVIFTTKEKLTRGSRRTAKFAEELARPLLHLHSKSDDPSGQLLNFVTTHDVKVLNIAGSRLSTDPEIYEFVITILKGSFPTPTDGNSN